MKVALTTPIQAHGKTIDEIELREPKGVHIRKCGAPYDLIEEPNGGTRSVFNAEACAKYIEVLGNIPEPSVNELSAFDFNKAMGAVISFFGQATPTSLSGTTGNSDGSIKT